MSSKIPNNGQESDRLQTELKQTLQRELFLTRELLANLHQTELSLIFQDSGTYQQLAHYRLEMLDQLNSLKTLRDKTTHALNHLFCKNAETLDLEHLLPDNEPIRWEILNLRDQLTTLNDKMNQQQLRNQHLTDHPEHLLSLQRHNKMLEAHKRPKRPTLTTYQIKK